MTAPRSAPCSLEPAESMCSRRFKRADPASSNSWPFSRTPIASRHRSSSSASDSKKAIRSAKIGTSASLTPRKGASLTRLFPTPAAANDLRTPPSPFFVEVSFVRASSAIEATDSAAASNTRASQFNNAPSCGSSLTHRSTALTRLAAFFNLPCSSRNSLLSSARTENGAGTRFTRLRNSSSRLAWSANRVHKTIMYGPVG